MNPIKILVGGIANPHIPGYCRGFVNAPDYPWQIVALAEHDPGRMAMARRILKGKEVKFYADWREMLDSHPDVEAFQIGSDNKYHFEMFRECIARGKHIYSTKVPTMDPEEGEELLKLTCSYPKTIQVELELHFRPQFRYARELVRSGRLGTIRSIYLSNVSQSPCNYFPNWGDPELSYGKVVPIRPGADYFRGGALTDHPHPFDMIRWITGLEFAEVFAVSARNQRSHLKVEDHVAVTGKLAGGVPFFINPSYSNLEEKVPTRRLLWPKSLECNLKITGDKGYYETDFFDKPMYLVGKDYVSPDRLIVENAPRPRQNQADTLAGSFAACVRGERKQPESSLRDGLAAVRVMNAAYEAIYRGETVYLPAGERGQE